MTLPPLEDILGSLRVVALPLAVRFRGVDVREAALFEGPEGWTEFSPFVEYDDDESATWLAGAIDYGWRTSPVAVRNQVPVNATVPAVAAEQVATVLARFDGCRTAKVKVAEPVNPSPTMLHACARCATSWDQMGASASTPTPGGTLIRLSVPSTLLRNMTSNTLSSRAPRSMS